MAASTEYKVGGEKRYETPGMGGMKLLHIREKVRGAGISAALTLAQKQPPKSRLVWAAIKAAGAVSVSLGGTSAAGTDGNIGIALVGTTPTSLATNASTANYSIVDAAAAVGSSGVASIADNTVGRGTAPSAATGGGVLLDRSLENAATTPRTLHLVPYLMTTAANNIRRFTVPTSTTVSTGALIGTSTSDTPTFDVDLYFEEYEEPAN